MCYVIRILRRFVLETIAKAELTEAREGKTIPLQAWTGPEVFLEFEAPRSEDNRHTKVVRCTEASALCKIPGNLWRSSVKFARLLLAELMSVSP
jgi:hypothetical protein